MAYQVAKGIGSMAVVFCGVSLIASSSPDPGAFSPVMGWITEQVSFLGRWPCIPAENEMEALAFGCLRVLRGEETPHPFNRREESKSAL
jgi:butyrate kinase